MFSRDFNRLFPQFLSFCHGVQIADFVVISAELQEELRSDPTNKKRKKKQDDASKQKAAHGFHMLFSS